MTIEDMDLPLEGPTISTNTIAELLAILVKSMPQERQHWTLIKFAEVYADREELSIEKAMKCIKSKMR